MLIFILASVLVIYLYLQVKKTNGFWKRKGVAHLKPLPFLGNMTSIIFQKRAIVHFIDDIYTAHANERYVGIYQFSQPILIIKDPDLIRTITVKHFDLFPDRHIILKADDNTLEDKALFNRSATNGWYDMRATLRPAYTSCKMKLMFSLVERCADQFVNYFEKQEEIVVIEMKETFTRFTTDAIVSTAFGITCNSMENQDNDLYVLSKELANGFKILKFLGYSFRHKLLNLFKAKFFDEKICAFFKAFIKESLKYREENQIIRPDIIYLLMEAKKERMREYDQKAVTKNGVHKSSTEDFRKKRATITDDDITAQALVFFFAGVDSTATLMSYVAYELALNPTIQRKLREEVDLTLKECNDELTYEVLTEMRYLDKVVSETLRKWPPASFIDRRSLKSFVIDAEKPDEKLLYLESGTVCWIPIYSIHRDAKFYPEPDKFDPERFDEKNKHNIKPFTYLPFGAGPRNCFGSRFALLETKLIILRILQKFEIIAVKKTQIPLKLSKKTFSLVSDAGFWLGLKPRVSCVK